MERKIIIILKSVIFAVLLLILAGIIWKNFDDLEFSMFIEHWNVSLIIVILAFIFVVIKSMMWFLVGRLYHVKKEFFHFVKVFCVSSFLELTTFSGKIGADGFKFYLWNDLSKRGRLVLLLFLRSADVFGIVLLGIFLFLPWYLIFGVVLLLLSIISQGYKQNSITETPTRFRKTLKKHWKLWTGVCLLSVCGYIIILTQLSLVFSIFGLEMGRNVFIIFLTSHALGALSQLPFGLGIKDYSIFYQLKDIITQSDIILALLWVRLFGEIVIVLLGGLFIALHLKKGN